MPPYMHPWQYNSPWRHPYYTRSMYSPGCPRFCQVRRPGFPWARQNPMAFLMSEILQGGPRSRGECRQDGKERCHQDQCFGIHPDTRYQFGSNPCCGQNESCRTRNRSYPCAPSTRSSAGRCDEPEYSSTRPDLTQCGGRTCSTGEQSRCSSENPQDQLQDTFEFVENVAMPILVEMLCQDHEGPTKASQEGACSSQIPENHPCSEQTIDTALNALIGMIAPFMDDTAARYPSPEVHTSKTSQEQKKSSHVKDKGQGIKSRTATASPSEKSTSEKTEDPTVAEKSDGTTPLKDKIASSAPISKQVSEGATCKAPEEPKTEPQRSASNKGEEARKKPDSENASQSRRNLSETPFDFMMNILGPFMHQMAQAQGQHHESPRSKTSAKSTKASTPKERASATESGSTSTRQEEFVTIPTWFGPMRVKVQNKANAKSQCRKDATKPEESKANQMENLVKTPPASRDEDATSLKDNPTTEAAKSKATSNPLVERMDDTQASESETSESSIRKDGQDNCNGYENNQGEREQIAEDPAIHQTGEEGPLITPTNDTITMEVNPSSNNLFVASANNKESLRDGQPLDGTNQDEHLHESLSPVIDDHQLQIRDDNVPAPMESENNPSSDKIQTTDEGLTDDPFAEEHIVEQCKEDNKASEPQADETQQPSIEEPESDEEFVVVERNALNRDTQLQEDLTVAENSYSDQASSSVGESDSKDTKANPDDGRMDLHNETQRPEQKVWSATFDLGDYSPEEIHVKTVGQQLVIEAEHDEESEDGLVSQEFRKTVTIPANVNPDDITCSLDDEGVLCAKAFRAEPHVVERPVPIALK